MLHQAMLLLSNASFDVENSKNRLLFVPFPHVFSQTARECIEIDMIGMIDNIEAKRIYQSLPHLNNTQ